jgi:hypothetical protein
MNAFSRLTRLLFSAGLIFSPCLLYAQSPLASSLAQALARRQWDQVLILGSQGSAADLETVASAPAHGGSVPAMWLMGQARYLAGDAQGSAAWLYAALLGTQMDVSLCRQHSAAGVVFFWTQALHPAVLSTRMDVLDRPTAIEEALALFQNSTRPDPLAGWTCQWAAQRRLVKDGNSKNMMLNPTDWPAARAAQLTMFRKSAGISLSALSPALKDDQTSLPGVPQVHH